MPTIHVVSSANMAAENEGLDAVKEWLTSEVKLKQYFDKLVSHGFTTLEACSIIDENALNRLEIIPPYHRKRLMKFSVILREKLRNRSDEEDNTNHDLARGNGEQNELISFGNGDEKSSSPSSITATAANCEEGPALPPKRNQRPPPIPRRLDLEAEDTKTHSTPESCREAPLSDPGQRKAAPEKPPRKSKKLCRENVLPSHPRTDLGGNIAHCSNGRDGDIGSAVADESVMASVTENQSATCVNDIGTEQHKQQTLNEPFRKASEEEPECRSPTGNSGHGKESQSDMSTIQPSRPVPTPPTRLSSSMSSSSFKRPVPAPRSRNKSEEGLDMSNRRPRCNSNEVTPAISTKRPMSFSTGQVRQPAFPNEKPSTLPRYPQCEKPPPPPPPTRQTPVTPSMRQPVETSASISSLLAPPATADETSIAPVSRVPGQMQNPLGTPDSQEYEEIGPRQRSQPIVAYDLLNPAVQDPRNTVANEVIYESVGSKPNNGNQETAEVEYESDDYLSEGADDLWMDNSIKMRSDSIDSAGGSDNSRGSRVILSPRVRKSEGYLWKQGGQQGNKGWRKRWFIFNGKDLRYFKDKDSLSESLHIIPVTQIKDIENVKDAKRSCFKVITPNRIFLLASENITEMILWSQTLMEASRVNQTDSISGKRGGDMNEPDKEGWLKKQGHNVVADWKKRYVAIKEDKICYYDTYEDFYYATPINCINAALAKVKIADVHRNRFLIITPNKSYSFQAETESEAASWMVAIETAIQIGLGDRMILEKVYENPSNRYCADCGMKDPVWASVNFCVCVCAHCIGVHRNLGVHCSKPRSLLMDEKVWNPTLLELMVKIGNANANQLLEHKLPDDDKILPDTESSLRREFIYSKYWEKKYCKFHPSFGNPDELGQVLQKTVVTEDVMTTLELIINKADVRYVCSDSEDEKPPIELAQEAGQTLQAELLRQNGAESGKLDRQISYEDVCGTVNNEVGPVSPTEIVYEKEGFLYKKEGSWRKRWFLLKERELKYTRGPHEKEELGVINLRTVTSLVKFPKGEPLQLDVVTVDKTHSLKADTDEELEAWYSALKNKQVFGVLLSHQELGSDGIPHLVAKCLQFVESYGGLEMEGVYRVNGGQLTMKKLETSFDQDAARVLLTLDECGVHDVTGVLKKYLRHLPDPVIPGDMYYAFIQAGLNPDHGIRLQTIKDLIASLPKVNHGTLKKIVFHLTKVVSCVAVNKMGVPNVAMIFGPTLMSNEQTGRMDDSSINQEFSLIGEMITYFQWLFDVNEEEVRKDQIMKDALEKIRRLQTESTQPQPSSEEFTLDIYVNEANEQPCRLKVSGDMTARMVCSQIVSQRALAPGVNWALFEVVGNGAMERAFQVREKVLAAAKWGSGNYLILKENYIAENIAPYVGSTLSIEGPLHTRDPKNKNWKQSSVCLKNGYMLVDKGKSFFKAIKSDKSETDQWPLHKMTLYVGIPAEKSTKGLDPSCGFTVVVKTDQEDITRYMCAKDKSDMHRWIAAVLNMKHPEGIWSDPSQTDTVGASSSESKTKQTEDLPFYLGRQSFNLRRKGSSKHIVEELRLKQKSLRRPVDKAPPPT